MATSDIQYRIQYSDRGASTGLPGPNGTLNTFCVIDPLATNTLTSLTFTGYRSPEYGQRLWTNLLNLLEHFASPTRPTRPVLGQIWFDTSVGIGSLHLCVNPSTSTWNPINSRIIVSDYSPIPSQASVTDQVLWYNPTNRGLFFWDPILATQYANNSPVLPYNTLWPDGPTDGVTDHPGIHPQIVHKWVNVLFHRYASTLEYNQFVVGFISWNLPAAGRPTLLPADQPPTDAEWINLIQYVRAHCGTPPAPATPVDSAIVAAIVDTTFISYVTDRFGIGLLQMYYDALVTAVDALYYNLTPHQTPLPVASFRCSQTIGALPMSVLFTDTSLNSAGSAHQWDFGDGSTSTVAGSVQHIYTTAGHFVVQLVITNSTGYASTYTQPIQAAAAPVASFSDTPTTGRAPLTVAFVDSSINTPTSWSWDFGDGNTSVAQYPTHVYATDGTFTTTLTVASFAGSSSTTATILVTPAVIAPVTSFTYVPTTGVTPLTVVFTDTSTNTPTSWSWDFGDGSTGVGVNPTHVYTAIGAHVVTLTTTNSAGSNTATSTVTVLIPAVVAQFSESGITGPSPLTSTFVDQSSNSPTSWWWSFGDGGTSTDQNPTHTYTTPGTYLVSLTASNSTGGSTSTADVANAIVVSPATTVTTPTQTVAKGDSVTFTVTSTAPTLYWTIEPLTGTVSGGEFVNGITGGSVSMVNGTGIVVVSTVFDTIPVTNDMFRLDIRTDSTNGPIVAVSSPVQISNSTAQFKFVADYIVLTYEFNTGTDLDQRTKVIDPPIGGSPVGWSQAITQLLPDGSPVLTWGGDNTGTGVETAMLNLTNYRKNFSVPLTVDCRCEWYGDPGSTPVRIFATLYRGGAIAPADFSFANGSAIASIEVGAGYANVTLNTQNGGTTGQSVALFVYDPISGAGTFTPTGG